MFIENWVALFVCLFVCLRAMVIWSKWVETHDGKEKFSLAINVVFPNCDQFNRLSVLTLPMVQYVEKVYLVDVDVNQYSLVS